jgi:hypothetical protein
MWGHSNTGSRKFKVELGTRPGSAHKKPESGGSLQARTRTRTNTSPYIQKPFQLAVGRSRSGCACGAQKARVCWGGVGRRGCRVAQAFFVWCSPAIQDTSHYVRQAASIVAQLAQGLLFNGAAWWSRSNKGRLFGCNEHHRNCHPGLPLVYWHLACQPEVSAQTRL